MTNRQTIYNRRYVARHSKTDLVSRLTEKILEALRSIADRRISEGFKMIDADSDSLHPGADQKLRNELSFSPEHKSRMSRFDDDNPRNSKPDLVELNRAVLCVDCNVISRSSGSCAGCGSKSVLQLAVILDRGEK